MKQEIFLNVFSNHLGSIYILPKVTEVPPSFWAQMLTSGCFCKSSIAHFQRNTPIVSVVYRDVSRVQSRTSENGRKKQVSEAVNPQGRGAGREPVQQAGSPTCSCLTRYRFNTAPPACLWFPRKPQTLQLRRSPKPIRPSVGPFERGDLR